MNYLTNEPCSKCGAGTNLKWTRVDDPTLMKNEGLARTCQRCGFREFVKALDEINQPNINSDISF